MNASGIAAVGRWMIPRAVVCAALCLSGMAASSSEAGFDLGFHNPLDDTELSWSSQPGASEYQLVRSTLRGFSADCTTFETSTPLQTDPTEPPPGDGLYYLVRVLLPEPGGWGTDSEGSSRPVPCMAPTGGLVDSSGCKTWSDTGTATRSRLTEDCIEYEYLGGGQLLLNHLNTAFNCCPEFEAGIEVEGGTITVREDETGGDCDCTCLFDLSYEVANLPPATYDVIVVQEYLDETDEPLDFTMDLQASPSGIHCVPRDHYPW